ncbi:MAG: flagellin hook IN motif-containing protein, partial [Pseudomonadota bacterium]
MASMINTNVASLSAQRSLSKSQDSLNSALQRLSSGLRINSAKDDAAGLAISTRMTSQINGMNQAIRNANDGISLAQTADSSLDEVTNNLQRIRDLALQAANGTNSADDRAALDVEVQQRLAEVNRIASQTAFNGINLLDGSFSSQAFQIGASANQTVTIDSIGSAKVSDLGLGAGTATGTALATSVAKDGVAAGSLSINGTTVTTDATTNSAKALAAAINGNATITASGVTATATNKITSDFTAVAATKAGPQGTALQAAKLSDAVGSVKMSTGALGAFTTTTTSAYTLKVNSGTNSVTVISAGAAGQTAADVDTALATASVKDDLAEAGITFSGSAAAGTLEFSGANVRLSESGGDAGNAGVKGFHTTNTTGVLSGSIAVAAKSLSINGTDITTTATATKSAADLAGAINAQTSTTGVHASASTTTAALGAFTTTSGGGTYNLSITSSTGGTVAILGATTAGVTGANIDTALATTAVANNLRDKGITMSGTAAAGTLKFSSADGATLTITEGASANTVAGGFATTVNGAANAATATGAATTSFVTAGTITLSSSNNITVGGTKPSVVGLDSGTYAGESKSTVVPNVTSSNVNSNTARSGLADKAFKINGTDIEVGTPANTTSASDIAKAINAKASTTGVYATAGSTTTASLGSFTAIDTTSGSGSYGLSVATVKNGVTSSVNIVSGLAAGATAADIDSALAGATVTANLATAGITVSGTAALGTLKFSTSDGSNIKLTEALDATTTGGFTSTINAGSTMSTGTVNLTSTSAITIADSTGGTAASAGFTAGTYGGVAAGSLVLNGTTIDTDSTTVGADKLAAAINLKTATTGVTATALATDSGSLGAFTTSVTAGYGMVVNGVKVVDSSTSTAGVTAAQIDAALATTGVGTVGANLTAAGITFTGTAAGGDLHFRSASGGDLNIAEIQGGTDKTGFFKKELTTAQQFSSTVTLSSSSNVTVGGTNPSLVGFTKGTQGVVNQTGSALSSAVATSGMAAGDLKINGTTIVTSSSTTSAKALAAAINDQSGTTSVTAVANATEATNLGNFKEITGYGSYSLKVGGVTVADVSDTHATHVNAAYIDTQLADSTVTSALSGAGITVSGTAVAGTLKFTNANGDNISITEGGTAAGASESLGSFVAINSIPAGNYRLQVSTGTGTAVDIVATTNSNTTQINAAYIDTQLASSSLQTSLSNAGISFTGSAAAGTLKFTSTSGEDVKILQDNGSGAALSASSLGAFTAIDSTGAGTYTFSVTSASGTAVNVINGVDSAATTVNAAYVDAQLAASTSALNSAGIFYTGSAAGSNLAFYTTDGSKATVQETGTGNGTGAAAVGFANMVSGTSIEMNSTSQGFTNLTGGVAHTVNTKVGFTNLDTDTASVTTSSVTLNSSNTITVSGNNPATATGLTSGTVGADKTYTLTVGDGTTDVDLSFDMSGGAFGVSIKATDVASAINNSAALQALTISAQIDANGKLEISSADARNVTLKESTDDMVNLGVSGTNGFSDTDAGAAAENGLTATAVAHMGQINLATTKDLTVAGTAPSAAGLTAGSFGGANVLSVTAANATLSAIDAALKNISSTRASLGA